MDPYKIPAENPGKESKMGSDEEDIYRILHERFNFLLLMTFIYH